MLLRSSSTPILNSWMPSPDPNHVYPDSRYSRSRSCISFPVSLNLDDSSTTRSSVSETDLRNPTVPKKKKAGFAKPPPTPKPILLKKSGNEDGHVTETGGGASGVDGGGGRGSGTGGGDRIGSGSSGSNHGSTDAYYHKMIEANPGNSLLLANYAKFLKEVRRTYVLLF